MKGVRPLEWTYISIAVALIIIAAAWGPVQSAVDTSIQNNARLLAVDIATSMNVMKSAPPGTTHEVRLPRPDCSIRIYENFVKVQMEESGEDFVAEFIQNNVLISNAPKDFECGDISFRIVKRAVESGGTSSEILEVLEEAQ